MPPDNPTSDERSPVAPAPASFGRVNIFFRMAIGLVAVFVITIFALIAVVFGDPAAPIAKLLDQIGMQLIVGEMCAILIVGTFAMTVDRRSALRSVEAKSELANSEVRKESYSSPTNPDD